MLFDIVGRSNDITGLHSFEIFLDAFKTGSIQCVVETHNKSVCQAKSASNGNQALQRGPAQQDGDRKPSHQNETHGMSF
jgi:hypothetical protein